jgi:hypothetical protein
MKYIFEEKDIEACLYVICQTAQDIFKNPSFAATVVYKIGFCNSPELEEATKGNLGSISCLTDGWYRHIGGKKEVCEWLNNDPRGFRPLTKEEYIFLVNSSNQGFLNK